MNNFATTLYCSLFFILFYAKEHLLLHSGQTQSLEGQCPAEFSSNHTYLEVSSGPEDVDWLNQLCLIRN